MRLNLRQVTMVLLLVLPLAGLVSGLASPASAFLGVAQVTTPPLSTSTTFSPTVTTTVSTSLTTTSTTTSNSVTSTSTTTTSTSTSFSYTATQSSTTTTTSISTSFTGTETDTSTSLTTTSITSTQTTTSTSTFSAATYQFPSCLIATATFGSELAPEVQFLRDFRDNQILHTAVGSAFMIAFNAWYYSFSPNVAGYESNHLVERTVMKGVLYPLIGILKLSSMTFTAAGAFPELAATLSGLVATSLIGAFYLGLPLSLVRGKIRRLRGMRAQRTLERILALLLLGGLAVLGLGEILTSTTLLMASSATVALSMLFLSAAFTSDMIARRLGTR